MELIPGLPDDLARECLVRVPYDQFPTVSLVCEAWKSEIQSSEFYLFRKQTCKTKKLIVVPHIFSTRSRNMSLITHFTVIDAETGVCSSLPPIPDLPIGSSFMLWELVSCMSGFVLLIPSESRCQIHVLLFDFLSNKWRHGSKIPGFSRLFYGSASGGDHMVYLFCSRYPTDNPGTSFTSPIAYDTIIAYDTVKDKWSILSETPPCYGKYRICFHHGKIHIVFQKDFEGIPTLKSFDVSKLEWSQSQTKFLDSQEIQRIICDEDGELYACSEGNVLALRGSTWTEIAKLPSEVSYAKFLTLWKRKLVVLGWDTHCRSCNGKTYELDLKNYQWKRVETTRELGYILSACSVEI